jgi:hypothetical protein
MIGHFQAESKTAAVEVATHSSNVAQPFLGAEV